ncbi:MAG TPA: ECF-type sigma factor [Pirellulaceae bacterium]|nr:ECF-type sigma factor [Pirellulaceae bacterium]
MEESSALLANRLASGDPAIPQVVVDRYIGRLLALVRPRISRQLGRRIDAEDVAQSAFRSFFRRAALGELELGRGAPLWRLLSSIALHKLLKQAEHHSAAKRSLQRETTPRELTDGDWLAEAVAGREPDPAAATVVADELESMLAGLGPLARQIVEMRLADYSHEEIATAVERSDRTVRRILADVQRQWQNRSTR